MVGPIAGAKVAEKANIARPIGCLARGSRVMMRVKASGISTPPEKPWKARSTIICPRLCAKAQATEKARNRAALTEQVVAHENTRASQPLSGMTMISATR